MPHDFTYANIGHGDKNLIISACACGASRILSRCNGNRYEWRVLEQIGALPPCTCPPDEDEEKDTMHPIEGFHTAQRLEGSHDDQE